ncbi:MAG TPA: histidine kinase [Bacillota bacterium]|nr:histidine kinase [Bacillota bacterium]
MKYRSMFFFMFINGTLSILTASAIMISLHFIADFKNLNTNSYLSLFLYVLFFISLFFLLIYRQGVQLRKEKERIIEIFEHLAEGIIILDRDRNIVKANQTAKQLLNIGTDEEVIDFCSICSNYPGCAKICNYTECFVDAPAQVRELRFRSRCGEDIAVAVTTTKANSIALRDWTLVSFYKVSDERKNEQDEISKMITHSILQAQETERKRISRELHDGIGQSLYGILIQSEILAAQIEIDELAQRKLGLLQNDLRDTIEDIRHLSVELRPSALDDLGLLAALENYFSDYENKFGIQVNFAYDGDRTRLPSAVETALYRIIQEAMTNAAKYSLTEQVDILLVQGVSHIDITIKDFGQGFDVQATVGRGVGLFSMRERAEILGGTLKISSTHGLGTSIKSSIPFGKESNDAANKTFAS